MARHTDNVEARLVFDYEHGDQALTFKYVNWHGDDHLYVIEVESLEYRKTGPRGMHPEMEGDGDLKWQWVIHGQTVTRDGNPRPELAGHPGGRRRSFLLDLVHPVGNDHTLIRMIR